VYAPLVRDDDGRFRGFNNTESEQPERTKAACPLTLLSDDAHVKKASPGSENPA
jgi:hypothetical protein